MDVWAGHSKTEITFVTDYMAVSGYIPGRFLDILRNAGITHVLNLTPMRTPSDIIDALQVMHIKTRDKSTYDMHKHFDSACAFIDSCRNVNGRILVHCAGGISRSTTICIAYLINAEKMSFALAFEMVKKHRRCTNPNQGFCEQLLMYERKQLFIEML